MRYTIIYEDDEIEELPPLDLFQGPGRLIGVTRGDLAQTYDDQDAVVAREIEGLKNDIVALEERVEQWKATAEDEADIGNERQAEANKLRARVIELEGALLPFAALGTPQGRAGLLAFNDPSTPDMVNTFGDTFDEVRGETSILFLIRKFAIEQAYAVLWRR